MPIKKSTLEQKWYYRIAKVFFSVIPFFVVIYYFINSGIAIPEMTQENIARIFQENVNSIVYAGIGLIAYYVILGIAWKTFIYIVFGGLEDDTMKKVNAEQNAGGVQPAPQSTLSQEDRKQIGFYLSLLFVIGVIYYAYFIWKPSGIDIDNGGNSGNSGKCIPTGCGSQWYCSGSYYQDNVQKRVNGCLSRKANETYPGWVGICRQCP